VLVKPAARYKGCARAFIYEYNERGDFGERAERSSTPGNGRCLDSSRDSIYNTLRESRGGERDGAKGGIEDKRRYWKPRYSSYLPRGFPAMRFRMGEGSVTFKSPESQDKRKWRGKRDGRARMGRRR